MPSSGVATIIVKQAGKIIFNVIRTLVSALVPQFLIRIINPAEVKIGKLWSDISALLPLPTFVIAAIRFCWMVVYSFCHEMLETSFLSLHLDESYHAAVNPNPTVRQPAAVNGDVHITQPCSLPTSPASSPRPSSVVSNQSPSPSPILGASINEPQQQQQQQRQASTSHQHDSGNQQNEQQDNKSSQTQPPQQEHPSQQQQLQQMSANYVVQSSAGYAVCDATSIANSASTSRDCTLEQDWQSGKICVRDRNAAMCNNELMADVYFAVSNNGGEPRRFPAHKYVLATGSTVFYAMFYGSLAETRLEIHVPDVEPEAFLKMLKYLYADEISLDEETVLATLNAAKKYMIPYLARACVQFMEASLTARNACLLLSQSRIFDEPDLMERCWEVIDAQAEMALSSEGFMDIDHATFMSILSRETLNCKEIHVFNAAISWATAECERRDIATTPENLRAALGTALNLIRIPAMELHEFADGPAQTGILSLEESHDLFLFFTATEKPKVSYPVTARPGLVPQVCHRFQSSAYRSNQWRYRGRCDSIQFSVDRRVFIVGFGLYGSSSGGASYNVRMELKKSGRILAENSTQFFSDGSSTTFPVYFRQPVQIDADTYYTASVVLDGLELSYFGQEGMTDVSVGKVAFQFQCSAESTNGTGVQGGQIPELIFYGPIATTSSVPK